MPSSNQVSSEFLANSFVNYLFAEYPGDRHVRRIASWIGFIVKALERVPGLVFRQRRSRQIGFEYKGREFKVRYSHRIRPPRGIYRGGVEILEVLPGRGAPEGGTAVTIATLADAEEVYRSLRSRLDRFLASSSRL